VLGDRNRCVPGKKTRNPKGIFYNLKMKLVVQKNQWSINRNFFFILIFHTLFNSAQGQNAKFERPALSSPDSWSIVLLPDPQNYHRFERNSPIFDLMTAWIGENSDPLNIKMVLCVGDLVIDNENINPDNIRTNLTSKQQWSAAARSFGRLDGRVPYITALGNHDYGYTGIDERRISNFDQFFPEDKNLLTQRMLREVGLNSQGRPSMENAFFEFKSPKGKKYLVLTLEFAPRDTTIAWAKKVVVQEKYKDHTVIVLTHSYLDSRGKHIETEKYPVTQANYGKAIWEKLVHPSSNIRMVFSGHMAGGDFKSSVSFRRDVNATNSSVHQMMFNAQALGGGNQGNGGDGWLRILEFSGDGKQVKVRTFSPFFAISPSTQPLAWRNDEWDNFTFQLEE
jgi:hypothetical protein